MNVKNSDYHYQIWLAPGFTFIELMLVIIILGILASLIMGNFFTSLRKGRDAQRKTDLGSIQKALEMFYEDKKHYPTYPITFGGKYKLCETKSATDCADEQVYMQNIPNDPASMGGSHYYYVTDADGTFFRLFSCIENANDVAQGVSQTGFDDGTGDPITDCGCTCRFALSSPNAEPLTPL